jgi:hypothetical protein
MGIGFRGKELAQLFGNDLRGEITKAAVKHKVMDNMSKL